jgi:hypothetical protein
MGRCLLAGRRGRPPGARCHALLAALHTPSATSEAAVKLQQKIRAGVGARTCYRYTQMQSGSGQGGIGGKHAELELKLGRRCRPQHMQLCRAYWLAGPGAWPTTGSRTTPPTQSSCLYEAACFKLSKTVLPPFTHKNTQAHAQASTHNNTPAHKFTHTHPQTHEMLM